MKKNKLSITTLLVTLILIVLLQSCSQSNQTKYIIDFNLNEPESVANEAGLDEKAKTLFINGLVLQQKREFAESILDFQEALRYDSSYVINYAIAKSYYELGRYTQSIQFLEKVLTKNDEFVPGMQLMADIYLTRYEIEKARNLYERIVELEPTIENKYSIGRLYEQDSIDKAIEIYEEILQDNESRNVLRRLSILYNKKGEDEKYVRSLERLYEANPDDEIAAQSIVEEYVNEKMYEEAIKFSDRLDNTLPNEALAGVYGYIGNNMLQDTTVEDKYINMLLNKIDTRFQTNWRLNLLGGFLSNDIGDTLKMQQYFSKSLKTADSIPEIPLQIGFFYLENEMFDRAQNVFRENIDKYPENEQFPFYLGMAYLINEEYEEAVQPLRKTLEMDSTFVDAYIQLGHIYDNLDKYDSTVFYYEKALELAPQDATINNNYAFFLAENDTLLDKAKEMSFIALDFDPTNSAYLDTYAWVNYKLGNYDDALTYIRQAVNSGTASAEVFEHMGDIYIKKGNIADAIDAYETALEMEPERQTAADKLNDLK